MKSNQLLFLSLLTLFVMHTTSAMLCCVPQTKAKINPNSLAQEKYSQAMDLHHQELGVYFITMRDPQISNRDKQAAAISLQEAENAKIDAKLRYKGSSSSSRCTIS